MHYIPILSGEYWYPCVINDGYLFPLDSTSQYEIDFSKNNTYNQIIPLLLSSKGRYIYLKKAGIVSFNCGVITINSQDFELNEEGKNLKDAQQLALSKFSSSAFIPDVKAFLHPQLCTWIALEKEQTTDKILAYADSYLRHGYQPGVIIIDDGWHEYIGSFSFDEQKIPNPKKLIAALHDRGFKVLLWLCPYVAIGSENARFLEAKNALVKIDGAVNVIKFFDGEACAIDFATAAGRQFFVENCERLKKEYGVDGFKLDCGDEQYFTKEYPPANELNRLYFDILTKEVDDLLLEGRSVYEHCCKNVIQRLADKMHIYGIEKRRDEENNEFLGYGLATVVPNMQLLGLAGYAFGCADMVGGGNINCRDQMVDSELLIRWVQASATFPTIQFSYPYWDSQDEKVRKAMRNAIKVHDFLAPYIIALAHNALKNNEPIIRYLEYSFPHQNLAQITDQFMIGNRYLFAPILHEKQSKKTVIFPKGFLFKNVFNQQIYQNQHIFDVDLDTMLLFEIMEVNS